MGDNILNRVLMD